MEKHELLIEPGNTSALLKRLGVEAKKRFGQNFLIDRKVLERILDGAEIGPDDHVLEIGPGIGSMTQLLCMRAGRVTAVEIDRSLIPVLEETLQGFDNVRIVNEDILQADLQALTEGKPYKVVANLPYYITTPVLMLLLESGVPAQSITVMVQKEVAERMTAAPGGKDYGALSLAVQYHSRPELLVKVPAGCFLPRPSVDSAVVRLQMYETPPVDAKDPAFMFRLIRAAFGKRRKTLLNALSSDPSLALGKDDVREALRKLGEKEDVRGERLSLSAFAALSELLGPA